MPLYASPARRCPRLLHRGDVLGDLIVAPEDAGGVGRVRHRVVRAAVVERVDQLRPDVLLEIRDVVEIERLDELAGDHLIEVVGRHLHDVGLHRAGRQLLDSGGDVVERRVLDLDAVLLPEVLQELLPEVGRVVEDGEGAARLGLEAGLDRVLPHRQRHPLVRPRERKPTWPDGLAAGPGSGAAGWRRRVAAGGEQRARARQPSAAPPDLIRKSRRVAPRSLGCKVIRPSLAFIQSCQRRLAQGGDRPRPRRR